MHINKRAPTNNLPYIFVEYNSRYRLMAYKLQKSRAYRMHLYNEDYQTIDRETPYDEYNEEDVLVAICICSLRDD
jgi:hypothetical protein